MKFVVGAIVRSAAGRDKGDFQVIMRIEDGYAWVSDGQNRPISKMKKKKEIHMFITKTVLDINKITTNKNLRNELNKFKSNFKK